MIKKHINILSALIIMVTSVSAQTTKHRDDSPKYTLNDSVMYPVDMEANYDQMLIDWRKDMRETPDCQFENESPIFCADSTYINRLYALPTRMELVFNPVVKQYIEMYAGRRRQQVSYMLGQGQFYFPIFENALDKEGLPLELKFLPIIESALNPIARSRVGATGLWQFMASTGKMYSLEVNSLVDERRDPAKSTAAAVKYLKDMYNIYGDWNLVIAAYNCGPGNVNKAIKRSGGQTDYWAIYPYLPRETRGYVPAFIAATYIMNYYNEHNICPSTCKMPAATDTLVVDRNLHLQQVSDVLNIPLDEIRSYNPQYTNDVVPGNYKSYPLLLPIQGVTNFIAKAEDIYNHRSQELLTHRKVAGLDVVTTTGGTAQTHRVKRGDTLSGIAGKYGVTVAQIKRWNGLKSNNVSVGRRLKVGVPAPKSQPQKEDKPQPQVEEQIVQTVDDDGDKSLTKVVKTKKLQTTTTNHKIKRGETLGGIADKYNVSVANIKKWNNLKSNSLVAGRSLKIQQSKYVEVEEIVKVSEPLISEITLDKEYASNTIENYVKSIDRDETSLPRIRISTVDDDGQIARSNSKAAQLIYHKVRIGETIPLIAKRYKVSKKDIMEWNKLSSGIAKVGQRLLIYLPNTDDGTSVTNNREQTPGRDALTSDNREMHKQTM